ncbi:hypothetical protein GE21DRAFT_3859 [Neurospora crassa]|uniref:Uncharacterized protein n=1 Tax=Neurospora crassa (strain ATCC 24698 / 74-OR23-1A / CBS 708.71 / DSM 1257 / FGSC 987) TaxID=367110 RepID=Q7SAU3_NEUCR|nr:hypothetical protein NCU05656 [Neurospora crassa OR74A]EAA33508.1 hypothetical protein NCU05656 [Neurospora crassa OR74A]KHE78341.1 hypothetical protein GE21DRAFT_3859 [Neurospora crassa]|eukprot:XP_962744.1 hypothetical protein NCU05656 [Neurospora crassa OR74A]
MTTSIFRPPYPEFHDQVHDFPLKSVSLEALVQKKAAGRRKRYAGVQVWGTPKKMTSSRSKEPVTVTWIVDPTQDERYEPDGPQIATTEEICREEADRLGLKYVVIRGAAHETKNIYVDGRTVTVWDASTGRYQNMQREADSHFTIYMGRSKTELLLQGHIYVVWDSQKFGGLDKMTDPVNQRKHVSAEDGERPVSHEYWSLTKDPLPAKSG